jgi:hypothetical protein
MIPEFFNILYRLHGHGESDLNVLTHTLGHPVRNVIYM